MDLTPTTPFVEQLARANDQIGSRFHELVKKSMDFGDNANKDEVAALGELMGRFKIPSSTVMPALKAHIDSIASSLTLWARSEAVDIKTAEAMWDSDRIADKKRSLASAEQELKQLEKPPLQISRLVALLQSVWRFLIPVVLFALAEIALAGQVTFFALKMESPQASLMLAGALIGLSWLFKEAIREFTKDKELRRSGDLGKRILFCILVAIAIPLYISTSWLRAEQLSNSSSLLGGSYDGQLGGSYDDIAIAPDPERADDANLAAKEPPVSKSMLAFVLCSAILFPLACGFFLAELTRIMEERGGIVVKENLYERQFKFLRDEIEQLVKGIDDLEGKQKKMKAYGARIETLLAQSNAEEYAEGSLEYFRSKIRDEVEARLALGELLGLRTGPVLFSSDDEESLMRLVDKRKFHDKYMSQAGN